ncbi:MAG: UPF0280 family protein [Candidatus Hermodarchaeota archaeon]
MKIYKTSFSEKESDITIISDSKNAILRAKECFYRQRRILEEYIAKDTHFLNSFSPVKVNTNFRIINIMAKVAEMCNVGPMASVAGTFADLMLERMKIKNLNQNSESSTCKIALVENGGEIAIDSEKSMKIALYAGKNELNLNLGFLIKKEDSPIGIGTSSATIGHAISFGQADAVTIFAKNAALADAAATKICNLVKGKDIEKSIKRGLDAVDDIDDLIGALIARKDKVGRTGKIPQLFKIEGAKNKIITGKVEDIFIDDYKIFK